MTIFALRKDELIQPTRRFPEKNKTDKTMKPYKTELTFSSNGLFLMVEATISGEDFNKLVAEGFQLLNNGTTMENEPQTPAYYFFKPYNA